MTRWLLIGEKRDPDLRAVMRLDNGDGMEEKVKALFERSGETVEVVDQEAARAVLIAQNLADGMSQAEAEHEAAIDLGELEDD